MPNEVDFWTVLGCEIMVNRQNKRANKKGRIDYLCSLQLFKNLRKNVTFLVMLTTKLKHAVTFCLGIHRRVSPGDPLHPWEPSATNQTESRHRLWILRVHHQRRKGRGNYNSVEVPLAGHVSYSCRAIFHSCYTTKQSKYFIPGRPRSFLYRLCWVGSVLCGGCTWLVRYVSYHLLCVMRSYSRPTHHFQFLLGLLFSTFFRMNVWSDVL